MSTTKDPQQKKAPVIQLNQEVLHNNLAGYVRKNLENILNELPDAEADRLCHAKRYERNAERASTRAGSYKRNFETTSGKVTLNIPKLRNVSFHSKCKVLGKHSDTVQHFKGPCRRSFPWNFLGPHREGAPPYAEKIRFRRAGIKKAHAVILC